MAARSEAPLRQAEDRARLEQDREGELPRRASIRLQLHGGHRVEPHRHERPVELDLVRQPSRTAATLTEIIDESGAARAQPRGFTVPIGMRHFGISVSGTRGGGQEALERWSATRSESASCCRSACRLAGPPRSSTSHRTTFAVAPFGCGSRLSSIQKRSRRHGYVGSRTNRPEATRGTIRGRSPRRRGMRPTIEAIPPRRPRPERRENERRFCTCAEARFDGRGKDRMSSYFEKDVDFVVRRPAILSAKERSPDQARRRSGPHPPVPGFLEMRRRDFADAITEQPAGNDSPRLPEGRQTELDRDTVGRETAGSASRMEAARSQPSRRRPAQMPTQDGVALLDRRAEGRLAPEQCAGARLGVCPHLRRRKPVVDGARKPSSLARC